MIETLRFWFLWLPPFYGTLWYWRAQKCIILHHTVCCGLILHIPITICWRHRCL